MPSVAELAVSMGRPEDMLPVLRLAAGIAPFHEPVQASLVTALGAAGQQAEALSVFRGVQARLADELGIDPGEVLKAAQQRVLSQTVTTSATRSGTEAPARQWSAVWRQDPPPETPPASGLVGRTMELAVLREALTPVFAGGRGLALVEGEPGVGKTCLLEEIAAEAGQHDALVVWGHCLEGEGTPSMWPWMQVVGTLLEHLASHESDEWLAGEIGQLMGRGDDALLEPVRPDSRAQFRLFEQVVAVLDHAAADRPLVLVIDDLQWADTTSLHLFSHLGTRIPRSMAVIGALRDRAPAPGSELARLLATASRVPGQRRIRLGPLGVTAVAELVQREPGRAPSAGAALSIFARTEGNPFFVRELARLLDDGTELTGAAAARSGVPSTVRDVVRDRMVSLDDSATDLLECAALIGRYVDVGLLARVAGVDVLTCLGRLEPVEALGLLGPTPGPRDGTTASGHRPAVHAVDGPRPGQPARPAHRSHDGCSTRAAPPKIRSFAPTGYRPGVFSKQLSASSEKLSAI